MKFDYLIVLEPNESKGISGKGMYKDVCKNIPKPDQQSNVTKANVKLGLLFEVTVKGN